MDVELIEIRDFLASHHPFDLLATATLDHLPKDLAVRYLRRGTPFPPEDADQPYLYVIRAGAIELRNDRDELVAKFGEGDLCVSPCLPEAAPEGLRGRTVEDTLLYLITCERLQALRRDNAEFDEHFSHSTRERLRQALQKLQPHSGAGSTLLSVAVEDLVTRAPIYTNADTSIQQAAELMTTERVSSLLIMKDTQLVGLVTDRDLRTRCVAQGLDYQQPVATIMTEKLHTVPRGTISIEALMTMTRLHIHHLPVVDGAKVLGIVSSSDLMRYQSANAVYVVGQIRRARALPELVEASKQMPELQVQLVAAGATAYHLGQAMSAVVDALTRQLITLAEEQLGPAPVAYVWLASGSQARREQTAHSDQDNVLVLSDEYRPDEHGDYFEALAKFVNDGLDACGVPYCPGEVMASNPEWRQPLRVWRDYFERWLNNPDHKAVMLANNFYDLRAVHGDAELFDELHQYALELVRENKIFLAYMTANALRSRPPLGFFRGFVLIRDGEHANTFDLKHGALLPITELARVYALSVGGDELNTVNRLRQAAAANALSREGAANLIDALEFIGTLRARHQAQQIKNGEPPDNYIHPDKLSPLERGHLKDVFSIITMMQDALGARYQAARFT